MFSVKEPIPMERNCVQFVTKYLGEFVMPKYMQMYIDGEAVNEIQNMIGNIKHKFVKVLKANKWLDPVTKALAVEKVTNIKYFIGYAGWSKSDNQV